MAVYENPGQMWFGTERRMQWIETPQTGADVSPIGMSAGSGLLNGGAFQRNSWANSKRFEFSWGDAAAREVAGAIHAYRNGTYGRGLIYFHDPMWIDSNVLPKFWADPSMAANYEAPPLIRDIWPSVVPTSVNANGLPVDSAVYAVPDNYDPEESGTELAIPVPPDHTLWIGACYQATGSAEIQARTAGGPTALTPLAVNATNLYSESFAGEDWVYLGIVNPSSGSGTLTIASMQAQILPNGITPDSSAGWHPGEGHSGCRFEGDPTLLDYTGLFGGQVGVAATFVEVGAWT